MANYWLDKRKAKTAWIGGGHIRRPVPSIADVFARPSMGKHITSRSNQKLNLMDDAMVIYHLIRSDGRQT